jgi:hypothetical protein
LLFIDIPPRARKSDMVFLIFTRPGYDELVSSMKATPEHLWVNPKVFSHEELERLRQAGTDATRFTQPVDRNDPEAVADVLDNIRLHHPGEIIWIELEAGASLHETLA